MLLKTSGIHAARPGFVRIAVLVVGFASIALLTHLYRGASYTAYLPSNPLKHSYQKTLLDRQRSFIATLQPLLERHAPKCPSPTRLDISGAIGFAPEGTTIRPDLIKMTASDLVNMKETHTGFLEEVKKKHDSGEFEQIYVKGTRGIVSTAGGRYMPVFLSSLRMIRRTGSKLPVELFLKDRSEYEVHLCETVLPSMNAKCLILDEIMNGGDGAGTVDKEQSAGKINNPKRENGRLEIAHYQLKAFAMLFSSFEEIMWVDADCFPLHLPDLLFDSEPFITNGMVVWPDFWASTASPLFFEIVDRPIPPMSERASSETGEFMISKRSHRLTLLLSAYYNFHGPSHYFRLLSQGAPGEGDKETFIAAALSANEPFYAVLYPVRPLGHPRGADDVYGSAMAQADPVEDHANRLSDKKDQTPHIFFIHAHFPKFDPATIFETKAETKPTSKLDGTDGRAWTHREVDIKRFGYDVERNYWQEITWVACNLERDILAWRGKRGICDRVKSYWENVFVHEGNGKPDFGE